MRLHTSLLLLLISLAVADAAGECAKSLVKGASSNMFLSSSPGLPTYECQGVPTVVDDTNYKMIQCDTTKGWQYKELGNNQWTDFIPPKPAGQPITINCVCHADYIQDPDHNVKKVSAAEITCNTATEVIKSGTKRYSELKCDKSGWKGDRRKINNGITNFTISCVTKKECDQSLITGFNSTEMEFAGTELKCKEPYKHLKYTDGAGAKKQSQSLACNANANWLDGTVDTGVSSIDELVVTSCEVVPCHEGLIEILPSTTTNPPADYTTETLSCSTGEALKINGFFSNHQKMTCSATGWKAGPTDVKSLTPTGKMTVECVAKRDSCFLINPWTVILNDDAAGKTTATCAVGEGLIHNKEHVKEVTCTKAGGWKSGDNPLQGADQAFNLECKKACSMVNHIIPALSTSEVTGEDTLIYCKEKTADGKVNPKNAIKLDGNFVHSNLKCNKNGFFDAFGKKWNEDPFYAAQITCEASECVTSHNRRLCTSMKAPHGYECIGSIEASPVDQNDDPNLLNCNKKPKHRLYNAKLDQFYSEPLRCNSDGSYYKNGEGPPTGIKVFDTKGTAAFELFCIQRICNKCDKLSSMVVGQYGLTYEEGTTLECAKATCPDDKWNVKLKVEVKGAQPLDPSTYKYLTVPYVGTVECSSEQTTGGKWMIDGKLNDTDGKVWIDGKMPIEDAFCILPGTTSIKCTEASPLTTTCSDDWKKNECEEVSPSLSDSAESKCSNGKKMFYMQRGGYAFEEVTAVGAKIECQATTGIWMLSITGTPIPLRRLATVICATSNPVATTTTTQPTTTTPTPQDVCDLCKDLLNCDDNGTKCKGLLNCESCVPKKDVGLYFTVDTKNSTDICTVKNLKNSKQIKTEKAGTVDQLICKRSEKKWTVSGKEAGKFGPAEENSAESSNQKMYIIIGGSIGGVFVLIVILAIVFKVVILKKRKPVEKDEETKKKMHEESKKKKTKRGDNDEILDQQSVDQPSELKL